MSEQQFQREVIEEVMQWSGEKIYSVFGSFLAKVVEDKKEELQRELKVIWKNRCWYSFRDTGEQFESDTMLIYFNPKHIRKYNLSDMEDIIERIENETNYSNPNRSNT